MKSVFRYVLKIENYLVLSVFRLLGLVGLFTFYQPVPQLGIKTTPSMTSRSQARWQAINESMPSGQMSVLDVGCNAGYFSINFAEKKHFVTGIDLPTYYPFCIRAKEALDLDNLNFSNYRITPKSVGALPNYDCIVCMSIFHHWCMAFGAGAGVDILTALFAKTNQVHVFRNGTVRHDERETSKCAPDMGASPEQWLHEVLFAARRLGG